MIPVGIWKILGKIRVGSIAISVAPGNIFFCDFGPYQTQQLKNWNLGLLKYPQSRAYNRFKNNKEKKLAKSIFVKAPWNVGAQSHGPLGLSAHFKPSSKIFQIRDHQGAPDPSLLQNLFLPCSFSFWHLANGPFPTRNLHCDFGPPKSSVPGSNHTCRNPLATLLCFTLIVFDVCLPLRGAIVHINLVLFKMALARDPGHLESSCHQKSCSET